MTNQELTLSASELAQALSMDAPTFLETYRDYMSPWLVELLPQLEDGQALEEVMELVEGGLGLRHEDLAGVPFFLRYAFLGGHGGKVARRLLYLFLNVRCSTPALTLAFAGTLPGKVQEEMCPWPWVHRFGNLKLLWDLISLGLYVHWPPVLLAGPWKYLLGSFADLDSLEGFTANYGLPTATELMTRYPGAMAACLLGAGEGLFLAVAENFPELGLVGDLKVGESVEVLL